MRNHSRLFLCGEDTEAPLVHNVVARSARLPKIHGGPKLWFRWPVAEHPTLVLAASETLLRLGSASAYMMILAGPRGLATETRALS